MARKFDPTKTFSVRRENPGRNSSYTHLAIRLHDLSNIYSSPRVTFTWQAGNGQFNETFAGWYAFRIEVECDGGAQFASTAKVVEHIMKSERVAHDVNPHTFIDRLKGIGYSYVEYDNRDSEYKRPQDMPAYNLDAYIDDYKYTGKTYATASCFARNEHEAKKLIAQKLVEREENVYLVKWIEAGRPVRFKDRLIVAQPLDKMIEVAWYAEQAKLATKVAEVESLVKLNGEGEDEDGDKIDWKPIANGLLAGDVGKSDKESK